MIIHIDGQSQWVRSPKIKTVWRSALLFIRHSKYIAMLSKIHSYWLFFRRFCPLGSWKVVEFFFCRYCDTPTSTCQL